MHECLGLYVFCDKAVLASKFTRKEKKIDPCLLKSYCLYDIKQVWTAYNYTHRYPGQQCLQCHLWFRWQCCLSLAHGDIRCCHSCDWLNGYCCCLWFGTHFWAQSWYEPPWHRWQLPLWWECLVFCRVLLPTMLNRERLTNIVWVFSFLYRSWHYISIVLIVVWSSSTSGMVCSYFFSRDTVHALFEKRELLLFIPHFISSSLVGRRRMD